MCIITVQLHGVTFFSIIRWFVDVSHYIYATQCELALRQNNRNSKIVNISILTKANESSIIQMRLLKS